MKITIESLKKAGAISGCPGASWFRENYPEGYDGEWSLEEQLALLMSEGRKWLGWAWSAGVVPEWSMSGVALIGADLTGADLLEADLTGADLTGADLLGADLRWANLREADLRGANLRWADLTGADLTGADLLGATWGKDTRWPEGLKLPNRSVTEKEEK